MLKNQKSFYGLVDFRIIQISNTKHLPFSQKSIEFRKEHFNDEKFENKPHKNVHRNRKEDSMKRREPPNTADDTVELRRVVHDSLTAMQKSFQILNDNNFFKRRTFFSTLKENQIMTTKLLALIRFIKCCPVVNLHQPPSTKSKFIFNTSIAKNYPIFRRHVQPLSTLALPISIQIISKQPSVFEIASCIGQFVDKYLITKTVIGKNSMWLSINNTTEIRIQITKQGTIQLLSFGFNFRNKVIEARFIQEHLKRLKFFQPFSFKSRSCIVDLIRKVRTEYQTSQHMAIIEALYPLQKEFGFTLSRKYSHTAILFPESCFYPFNQFFIESESDHVVVRSAVPISIPPEDPSKLHITFQKFPVSDIMETHIPSKLMILPIPPDFNAYSLISHLRDLVFYTRVCKAFSLFCHSYVASSFQQLHYVLKCEESIIIGAHIEGHHYLGNQELLSFSVTFDPQDGTMFIDDKPYDHFKETPWDILDMVDQMCMNSFLRFLISCTTGKWCRCEPSVTSYHENAIIHISSAPDFPCNVEVSNSLKVTVYDSIKNEILSVPATVRLNNMPFSTRLVVLQDAMLAIKASVLLHEVEHLLGNIPSTRIINGLSFIMRMDIKVVFKVKDNGVWSLNFYPEKMSATLCISSTQFYLRLARDIIHIASSISSQLYNILLAKEALDLGNLMKDITMVSPLEMVTTIEDHTVQMTCSTPMIYPFKTDAKYIYNAAPLPVFKKKLKISRTVLMMRDKPFNNNINSFGSVLRDILPPLLILNDTFRTAKDWTLTSVSTTDSFWLVYKRKFSFSLIFKSRNIFELVVPGNGITKLMAIPLTGYQFVYQKITQKDLHYKLFTNKIADFKERIEKFTMEVEVGHKLGYVQHSIEQSKIIIQMAANYNYMVQIDHTGCTLIETDLKYMHKIAMFVKNERMLFIFAIAAKCEYGGDMISIYHQFAKKKWNQLVEWEKVSSNLLPKNHAIKMVFPFTNGEVLEMEAENGNVTVNENKYTVNQLVESLKKADPSQLLRNQL